MSAQTSYMLRLAVFRSSAERKNMKTLSQYWGGRQHRTTPAGQILGVATPAAPAALTPMDEEGGVTYSESQ